MQLHFKITNRKIEQFCLLFKINISEENVLLCVGEGGDPQEKIK